MGRTLIRGVVWALVFTEDCIIPKVDIVLLEKRLEKRYNLGTYFEWNSCSIKIFFAKKINKIYNFMTKWWNKSCKYYGVLNLKNINFWKIFALITPYYVPEFWSLHKIVDNFYKIIYFRLSEKGCFFHWECAVWGVKAMTMRLSMKILIMTGAYFATLKITYWNIIIMIMNLFGLLLDCIDIWL